MGDRYRLVEPIERFTPASGGPSGAGFGYWLAFDETRGREVWLLFAENRGRAASGADVAGAVSVLRRLGHRAVPAVPDFGEFEFEAAADAEVDAEAEAGAEIERIAEPIVEAVGYAVLEPIEGESLSALLMRSALTEVEIYAVLREIAELLRVLHAAELVHGHLSIYSVLVAERGVRLVDLPAALALESAFDSGLTFAADVYAFCWLACLALVGVDVVEAELGAGYDEGSSPEDAFALAFLTADLIGRRRAWAEAALVDVYGLRADLAALLVAGLGEASQRPTIEAIAALLGAARSEAAELAGAAGLAAAGLGVAGAAVAADEARGEMIGIVAGETGYAVQVGGLAEAEAGGAVVEEVGEVDEVEEEESAVAAEAVAPQDTRPTGAELAAAGVAAGGIAVAAAMGAEAATAQSDTVETTAAQSAVPQTAAAQAVSVQEAEVAAQESQAGAAAPAAMAGAGAVAATEMAAAASPGRSGAVGVARRPTASPTGSGSRRGSRGAGSGSPGSGSGSGSGGPTTPSSPVAFTAGAHRRPPKSAVLVAAGITVLILAGGAWALAEHRTVPSKAAAGPSSSASALAQSPSAGSGGAGSSAKASASASASASHASPTAAATGSPAAGSGATPGAGPTTPTPGPLATAPSSPSQALSQVKQAISQAQALGQFPAAAQGPFNQAVGSLQQEISGGSSVQSGTSQLQSALGTPGLPTWFTSQLNQLIPYLTYRPGS